MLYGRIPEDTNIARYKVYLEFSWTQTSDIRQSTPAV